MILDIVIALAVYEGLKKSCQLIFESLETYFYIKNKGK